MLLHSFPVTYPAVSYNIRRPLYSKILVSAENQHVCLQISLRTGRNRQEQKDKNSLSSGTYISFFIEFLEPKA